MHLSQEAVDATLRLVATLPQASEIVFTFSQPVPDGQEAGRGAPGLAERAAQLGEPSLTRIVPDDLVRHLRALGFASVRLPTPAELTEAYIGRRPDGLRPSRRQTIASALV